MASFASACRLSARVAGRTLRQHGASRAFHAAPAGLAAHNFTMPALSPTMTEGNIASWKVREGDSYAAGDVLLEIETDKAQMDVEAQDDGILAKITVEDGTKGVQVGSRIAVTAEPDDDLSTLEIPAEDKPAAKPKEESKEVAPHKPNEESTSPVKEQNLSQPAPSTSKSGEGAKAQKQKYPLYPSVAHLLKENGLPKDEADKIPSTGPGGRLLKGDVLAYLGTIGKSYPLEQSKRIGKLAHLDLSNIKLAPPKKEAALEKPAAIEEVVEEVDTEIAVSISLTAVLECQKRIQDSVGIFLPISTFIARASELANDSLPRSKTAKPSADELFNAVLGLDKVAGPPVSRGRFVAQASFLPASPFRPAKSAKPDTLDFLSGKKKAPRASKVRGATGAAPAVNVFSVSVPKGDEQRGLVFLERVKSVLEAEPGRLVL